MSRYTPLGYERITGLSVAKALTVPEGATVAVIKASTQIVRLRDDGTDPTASVGFPIADGETFTYEGDLDAVKLIEATASATVHVLYYT